MYGSSCKVTGPELRPRSRLQHFPHAQGRIDLAGVSEHPEDSFPIHGSLQRKTPVGIPNRTPPAAQDAGGKAGAKHTPNVFAEPLLGTGGDAGRARPAQLRWVRLGCIRPGNPHKLVECHRGHLAVPTPPNFPRSRWGTRAAKAYSQVPRRTSSPVIAPPLQTSTGGKNKTDRPGDRLNAQPVSKSPKVPTHCFHLGKPFRSSRRGRGPAHLSRRSSRTPLHHLHQGLQHLPRQSLVQGLVA